MSTVAECTLPCKDLRVTRRGIAALYVLTSRWRAGGENEGDAALIRNIYAGRFAREHVLRSVACLSPLDHAARSWKTQLYLLNAIKIDDLNK